MMNWVRKATDRESDNSQRERWSTGALTGEDVPSAVVPLPALTVPSYTRERYLFASMWCRWQSCCGQDDGAMH